MLYAMLLGGDEDYEEMADIKRNRLLVIPGTGTGIPLRPDLFLLPKVTGEHSYRMLTEMGTSDAAKFREAVTESLKNTFLSPTVVPQVVKPWVEVMANYDPFTERPLVGTYEKQQLLASMQTNDRTSELAKALAAASGNDNFSPIAVDHIIRGMFGSVGGVVLYASNQMMTPASGAPRAELSLRDALATFPGLGSVVGKDIEGGAAADFYQLREVTRKAKTTLDRVEERMPQLLDKYLDNPRFMARVELADEVEYISQRLAKLREYKIAVQSATDMTPQEKQRELREIAESQQEWLKSAPMREWRARAQLR
ncbi:MAG TPA: LPD38 domain-containing protein, partial [Burkholderiaceae bacterium]|nr:LPD38 domain-containing protein [Burkholderiaceae bacterium]